MIRTDTFMAECTAETDSLCGEWSVMGRDPTAELQSQLGGKETGVKTCDARTFLSLSSDVWNPWRILMLLSQRLNIFVISFVSICRAGRSELRLFPCSWPSHCGILVIALAAEQETRASALHPGLSAASTRGLTACARPHLDLLLFS